MDEHDCVKREEWGMLREKLKHYDSHLDEANKTGGFRDRVSDLERSMRFVPWTTALCAFCGGLVAQIVPQLGVAIADFIAKIQ